MIFFFSASESPWKPKRHAGGANIFVPKNKYEELILVTICFYIDLKEILNHFDVRSTKRNLIILTFSYSKKSHVWSVTFHWLFWSWIFFEQKKIFIWINFRFCSCPTTSQAKTPSSVRILSSRLFESRGAFLTFFAVIVYRKVVLH